MLSAAFAGSALGFIASAAPEGIKLYRERRDLRHELEVMRLQMVWDQIRGQQRREDISLDAATGDSLPPAKLEPAKTGDSRVDVAINALISSVRPLLTFGIFATYAVVKLHQGAITWTGDDVTLLTTILSYWFGGRAMTRAMGYRR